MTKQELKEKLFKIAIERDDLGRKIGRLIGAIAAEEELKKDYKNGIFTFERDKEIERLKAENKRLQEQLSSANAGNVNCSGCAVVETNAIKEFARKVKNCSYCDNVFMDGKWHRYVFVDDIDKLLTEYEK